MSNTLTMLASETKPEDGEIFQSFHCSICLGLLDEPRILPGCGHSFCTRCLRGLFINLPGGETARQMSCPECRKSSLITPMIGIEGLGLNASLKEAAVLVKNYYHTTDNNHNQVQREMPLETCPHIPFVVETGNKCSHCGDKEFCLSCQIIHIETMRLEINFMSTGFQHREASLERTVEGQIASAKNHFQAMVSTAVRLTNDDERLAARKTKEDLVQKATQFGTEKAKQLDGLRETFNQITKNRDQLEKKVVAQQETISPLCLSLGEVSQLYNEVFEVDTKLWQLENFHEGAMSSKISFQATTPNPKPQAKKARKISASINIADDLDLVLNFPVERIPSEIKRLQKAVRDGDLALLKSVLLRRGLTSGSRRFVIGTKFGQEHSLTMLSVESKSACEIVRFLAEQGAKLDAVNGNGQTLLHRAILSSACDVGLIKTLLDVCPALIKPTGGASPVDMAIIAGKTEIVELLKKRESKPLSFFPDDD